MTLLNSSWLGVDPIAKNIIDKGESLTLILQEVDDIITMAVLEEGLDETDIAVDGSGYVTSLFLKWYGIYYALHALFRNYSGSGAGNALDDVYATKAAMYEDEYKAARAKITTTTITGADGTEAIDPEDMVSPSWYLL